MHGIYVLYVDSLKIMSRWDSYMLGLCEVVCVNVVCPSRSIGVVIARGKSVVSTGYNGPPSGFPHPGSAEFFECVVGGYQLLKVDWGEQTEVSIAIDQPFCPRRILGVPSGERLSLCPCAHAERNAISQAAKMGHATEGCTLYLNAPIPCLDCAYSLVAAGITEVVVSKLEAYPQEGFTGEIILRECGVVVREFC